MRSKLALALLLVACAWTAAAKPTLEQIAEFAIPEANQGIGADEKHFYAGASPAPPKPSVEQIAEFAIPEANQGIGVDEKHFYAVDDRAIAKYDKKTGKLVK